MLLDYDINEMLALSPEDACTLSGAIAVLFDELKQGLVALSNNEALRTTWLYGVLPSYAITRLDMRMCENFMITLATIAYKVFGPRPARLVCIGEILLLDWAIQMAKGLAESEEEPFDLKRWHDFQCRVTDPLNIQLIYDPQFDGMDQLYPDELSVDTWFITFAQIFDDVSNPMIRSPAIANRYTRRTD